MSTSNTRSQGVLPSDTEIPKRPGKEHCNAATLIEEGGIDKEDLSSDDEETKVPRSLARVDINLPVLEELKEQPKKLITLKEHLFRKEELLRRKSTLCPTKTS